MTTEAVLPAEAEPAETLSEVDTVVTVEPAVAQAETSEEPPDEPPRPDGTEPVRQAPEDPVAHRGAVRRRSNLLAALAGIVVIGACLAVWSAISAHRLRDSGPMLNGALVDAAATNAVVDQVGRAIRTSFSYDYTTLERTEQAARGVLVGNAVAQYEALFGRTRQQAVADQTVLTTAVRSIGVLDLRGDRARLLVFVDRQIVRTGTNHHESAAGQLMVTADRVAGQWKISDIQVL